MIEVVLIINGKSAFEYTTNSIPSIGDYIDIEHEYVSGCYKVTKVIHKVFQRKNNKEILSYVKVEAETNK